MGAIRTCRHCGKAMNSSRPRDLCWSCYYTPGVRAQYPPLSAHGVFGSWGDKDFNGRVDPPDQPTRALAGTEEKILVLAMRVARRQALFHPLDEVRQ